MKHFISTLKAKASAIMEEDLATRGRSPFFRATVLTLVATSMTYIFIMVIKTVS